MAGRLAAALTRRLPAVFRNKPRTVSAGPEETPVAEDARVSERAINPKGKVIACPSTIRDALRIPTVPKRVISALCLVSDPLGWPYHESGCSLSQLCLLKAR